MTTPFGVVTAPVEGLAVLSSTTVVLDAVPPAGQPPITGPLAVTVGLDGAGGQIGTQSGTVSETTTIIVVALPTVNLTAGSPSTVSFEVQNTGGATGTATVALNIPGLFTGSQSAQVVPGATQTITFSVSIPATTPSTSQQPVIPGDLSAATYDAENPVTAQIDGTQYPLGLNITGASVTATASLDQSSYVAGSNAVLTLDLVGTSGTYSVTAALDAFSQTTLVTIPSTGPGAGTATVSFTVPVAFDQKLHFSVSEQFGQAMYSDALYLYRNTGAVQVGLDQQIYQPLNTATVTVTAQSAGTVTFTAPGPFTGGTSDTESMAVAGGGASQQVTFAVPDLTAGSYSLDWSYSPSGGGQPETDSVPFDVQGAQAIVNLITLPGVTYCPVTATVSSGGGGVAIATYSYGGLLGGGVLAGGSGIGGPYGGSLYGGPQCATGLGYEPGTTVKLDVSAVVNKDMEAQLVVDLASDNGIVIPVETEMLPLTAGDNTFGVDVLLPSYVSGTSYLTYQLLYLDPPLPGGNPALEILTSGAIAIDIAGTSISGLTLAQPAYTPGQDVTGTLGISGGGSTTLDVDVDGTTVATPTVSLNGGYNELTVDFGHLGAGSHTLTVTVAPAGATFSLPLDVTAPTPAGAPIGLSVGVTGTSASLRWFASLDPSVTGYRIYRSLNGGAPVLVATVGPAAEAYVDAGLAAGTYTWTISSLSAPGESTRSRGTSATVSSSRTGNGYWLVASDGGIFAYGTATFHGSAGSLTLNKPVVGMAATADDGGYWLVASDGGIFAYGDAAFHGSAGSLTPNKPVVGMAVTPDGGGYWLVASDGGIFAYGDAGFYGSTGSITLNRPVVGMAPTPDGRGYWLVASDGGIFAYGDAGFYGSTGSITLNRPVVGMAPTADGRGYWLVASDGGIFAYGDAGFHGSTGSIHLNQPVVGMAPTPDGAGYWLVAADGGIFAYGDAGFFGSAGSIKLNEPIVGMADT
jgi:hypothetical protein